MCREEEVSGAGTGTLRNEVTSHLVVWREPPISPLFQHLEHASDASAAFHMDEQCLGGRCGCMRHRLALQLGPRR